MILAAMLVLAQAGSDLPTVTAPGMAAPQPIPHRQRPPEADVKAAPAPAPATKLTACLAAAHEDPSSAAEAAAAWRQQAKGGERAQAEECRGVALAAGEEWTDAEQAFVAARDISTLPADKARYGAMAGNAALAGGEAARAETELATAHADALSAGDKRLAGDIAIDRSRALVALHRDGDAAAALDEGRGNSPGNATGWLLSATLARRHNDLANAQRLIERAADLDPVDPAIGLEAGVIAVLGGREEAARKSWQSVIAAAPASAEAKIAQGYLDQLGPPSPSGGQ